jgi:hypothetical protein
MGDMAINTRRICFVPGGRRRWGTRRTVSIMGMWQVANKAFFHGDPGSQLVAQHFSPSLPCIYEDIF